MAQKIPASGKAHSQGMSYEEYSTHREKMCMRMEKVMRKKVNRRLSLAIPLPINSQSE